MVPRVEVVSRLALLLHEQTALQTESVGRVLVQRVQQDSAQHVGWISAARSHHLQ